MNWQQAYIDVMAVIGTLCVCFLIALSIIWAVSGKDTTNQTTRPLPAEPFPATTTLEEVR